MSWNLGGAGVIPLVGDAVNVLLTGGAFRTLFRRRLDPNQDKQSALLLYGLKGPHMQKITKIKKKQFCF